jgi:hypothetical protein
MAIGFSFSLMKAQAKPLPKVPKSMAAATR